MGTSSANLAAAVKFLSNLLARSRTDRRLCCSDNWTVSFSTTSFKDKPLLSSFDSSTIWLSGPNLYFGKQLEEKLTSAETDRSDSACTSSSISGLIFVIVSDQILCSSQVNTSNNLRWWIDQTNTKDLHKIKQNWNIYKIICNFTSQ